MYEDVWETINLTKFGDQLGLGTFKMLLQSGIFEQFNIES